MQRLYSIHDFTLIISAFVQIIGYESLLQGTFILSIFKMETY